MRTVFVLFDSLNRHMLGAYGGTYVHTPNFDRFASRAITFDNHYAGSLPCMPARRDLHTGRLNFMHRSWGPLEPFDNSLPKLLSEAGTYTHIVTDHQHYFEDGGAGYCTAYDSWQFFRGQENDPWIGKAQPDIGLYEERYDERHYPIGELTSKTVTRRGTSDWGWKRLRGIMNQEAAAEDGKGSSAKCVDEALAFLASNQEAPDWFLQVEAFDPHEPFVASERFKDLYATRYQGKILNWPPYAKNEYSDEEAIEIRAQYAALVMQCDDQFGRLLDFFDAHGLWTDTCLVLTTDHGFLLGEHDWWGKNRMPYYEEVSHIPLIIHHPDFVDAAGTRRQALTQTIDLMPTFLQMHGIAVPREVTGQSLLPLLECEQELRDSLVLGMFGGPICTITETHSYFRYPVNSSGEGLNEYTLMPSHMADPFKIEEFAAASLAEPFDFTKGIKLLKLPASREGKRPPGRGHLALHMQEHGLFYLREDPGQQHVLCEESLEAEITNLTVKHLQRHDAPREYFQHYSLDRNYAA